MSAYCDSLFYYFDTEIYSETFDLLSIFLYTKNEQIAFFHVKKATPMSIKRVHALANDPYIIYLYNNTGVF